MSRSARRLLLTALAACSALALLASAASANRLSVSDVDFDIRWTSLELSGPTGIVRCPVTLLGSFHSSTIVKVRGLLIGYIRHARVGNGTQCTNGRATILTTTLPWHIRYLSFTGTLPRIATVKLNLIRAAFRVQIGGTGDATCLATTTVEEPANGIISVNSSGQATGIAAEGSIDLTPSPSELCDFLGANGSFSGTGTVEDLRGGLVFVRLI